MAATTTLISLLSDLAEELDLGLVIAGATGVTTTITLTGTGASELRGPFTGAKIAIGSPVTVITAGTVGEDTYVSNFVTSTGVVTLSPAITTGATSFIIWDPVVKHGKNVEKAISRAHQKCRRWMKVPLTYVPDGEMLGAVASFWTGTGTETYASLAAPGTAGAQVLNLAHSGATTAQSNTIPAHASDTWRFETAIRAVTATGVTAALVIYDVTNSAAITPTYELGDGSTTSNAFETQKGTFTVPATCDQIAFRLTIDASGDVQMAPIIAYPQGAMSFPFTNRVLGPERVGNYFYSYGGSTDRGPDERWYSDLITTGGRQVSYSNNGDHLVATFNFAPAGPIYYDELIFGGALAALTDTVVTTTFPADMVKLWARAELYDFLMRSEMRAQKKLDNGQSAPSSWRSLRNAAYTSAKWSNFEPKLANIVGRV